MLAIKKGFTLIELLVVISLIGILSVMGMGNFKGSQKRGRDLTRQSDLNQYRVALENYASNNNGVYPKPASDGDANVVLNSSAFLSSYMTGFPADSQWKTYRYSVSSDGLNYVLDACTELQTKLFEICSNGKSGLTSISCSTTPTLDSTCDL